MTTRADTGTDADLARAVLQRGDERAFRTLFERHSPALSQFIRRVLGCRAGVTEDLVQETWLRAVQALDRFRWDSSFRTWLLGIGLNMARQELRRRATLELIDDVALARCARVDERVDLERAIARLPDGFRTVLVLHDIHGFTHEDIGRLLGIAPGTSKSQLSRARGAVRAMIGSSYLEKEHECI